MFQSIAFLTLIIIYALFIPFSVYFAPRSEYKASTLVPTVAVSIAYICSGVWIWWRLRKDIGHGAAIGWTALTVAGVTINLAVAISGIGRSSHRYIAMYSVPYLAWSVLTLAILATKEFRRPGP